MECVIMKKIIDDIIGISKSLHAMNIDMDEDVDSLRRIAIKLAEDSTSDCKDNLEKKRKFSKNEAKEIGDKIGVNWDEIDLNEFRMGLSVELEHGKLCSKTNITDDNEEMTGKIAHIHLIELKNYYTLLHKMEKKGKEKSGEKE